MQVFNTTPESAHYLRAMAPDGKAGEITGIVTNFLSPDGNMLLQRTRGLNNTDVTRDRYFIQGSCGDWYELTSGA